MKESDLVAIAGGEKNGEMESGEMKSEEIGIPFGFCFSRLPNAVLGLRCFRLYFGHCEGNGKENPRVIYTHHT